MEQPIGGKLDRILALVQNAEIQIDFVSFSFSLVVSLLAAVYISALYQVFFENRATGAQIHRSFLLMSPAITALFIAIQFSLPLSLGLLGALSIIRFRTPIKEPEEIGFIMLLIASSVVCATFQFLLLLTLLVLVTVALLMVRYFPILRRSKRQDGVILVAFSDDDGGSTRSGVLKVLSESISGGKLESISQSDGMTTLQYSFRNLTESILQNLQESISQVTKVDKLHIYFNAQGALA